MTTSNPARTHNDTDSSVLCNLREIMQLEEERLAAEQAQARAEQEAAERKKLEAARQQAELVAQRAAADRAAEEAAALQQRRLEAEHAALLLQTRLRAEAAERVEAERMTLQREEACRRERRATRRATLWRTSAFMVVGLAVSAVLMAYLTWFAPTLSRYRGLVVEAEARAAARERDMQTLGVRLETLEREADSISRAAAERAVLVEKTSEAGAGDLASARRGTQAERSTRVRTQSAANRPIRVRKNESRASERHADRRRSDAEQLDALLSQDADPLFGLQSTRRRVR